MDIVFNLKYESLGDIFYSANGETLNFSLNLDRDTSTPGLSVKQIEVFLSNIKIAECHDSERLDVSFPITKKAIGKHPLRFTFKAAAPGHKEATAHINTTTVIMSEKPIYGFILHSPDIWDSQEDIALSVEEVPDATLHMNINEVSYLIDNDVIVRAENGARIVPPMVSVLPKGRHILQAIIKCGIPEDDFSTVLILSKTIMIQ